ncbi:MAG: hypothetical protein J3Q66DRAFT_360284 [Benniella sp.]|nr:MAG: hypothetical protein J3Q66DRAFT_360284 [Benniella sp.]
MEDVEWMVDSWKKLKEVKGYLHVEPVMDAQLRDVFKSHGIDAPSTAVYRPPYTLLPPAFSITAPQLDSTTHTISMRWKRECKLAKDDSVKSALKTVSEQSSTGSRIKGFSRRGGRRFRKEHRQHTVVAITPEYRTSKTCSFCFSTLQKVRHRRLKGGAIVDVSINGALQCLDPDCPTFQNGCNISNRDQHAAFNIRPVGASLLLSSDHQVLPAFSKPTIT